MLRVHASLLCFVGLLAIDRSHAESSSSTGSFPEPDASARAAFPAPDTNPTSAPTSPPTPKPAPTAPTTQPSTPETSTAQGAARQPLAPSPRPVPQPAYGANATASLPNGATPGYGNLVAHRDPGSGKKQADDESQVVSLTFSPLRLALFTIVEGKVEFRAVPHFGLAMIGGYGSIDTTDDALKRAGLEEDVSFDAFEVGGQLNLYPLESFGGLHLGLEILYVGLSADETVEQRNIKARASAVAVGPLVGYKLLTAPGFTLSLQAGVQRLFFDGSVEDDATKKRETASDSRTIPLVNANIGWSI